MDSALAKDSKNAGFHLQIAAEKGVPIAERVMQIFVELLAAEAGNIALKGLATGGVYLGGGIVPKIISWLKDRNRFTNFFVSKGRFKEFLERIPVNIINDPHNALRGAALYALAKIKN